MMISLSTSDLKTIIADAVALGMMQQLKLFQPDMDIISRAEAKRMLTRRGYKPSAIDKWEGAGLITSIKCGGGRNSKRAYSSSELMQLLASLDLKQLATD